MAIEQADAVSAVRTPLETASDTTAPIQRLRLTLAVERWPGGGATLYGAAQGAFLALLRAGDSEVARQSHDAAARRPFALSPLRIAPAAGTFARAELIVSLWDGSLAKALQAATAAALDRTLDVAGHPAHVLDCQPVEETTFARLLEASLPAVPPGVSRSPAGGHVRDRLSGPKSALWVRFATPTVFSWGRGMDGRHHYGLLPAPELVVGSWLRAWNAGGGPEVPFQDGSDWLRDHIRLLNIRALRTVTVHTGKTPLSGFVGEVAYEWCGALPGGQRTLRALAGFARFCGTGAKTAYGLGQTEISLHG